MTKEEKQLLLQELSARLPYNVIGKFDQPFAKLTFERQLTADDIPSIFSGLSFFIPYLRPISSMTEEEMDMLFDILHINKDGKDDDWIKINDVYGIKFFFPSGKWIENVAEVYDYLYSIHIDFRGLIRKGLAIEITKENNLYEE